jgi:tripartite-type tricarboxylate transporter receptor subunit TctC
MFVSLSLRPGFKTLGLAPALLAMRAVLVAVAAALCVGSARAQSVESFYQGKTITLVLFTTAASIYDTYARMLVRVVPRHIPGHPALLIKYMPGAGGVLAARHLAEVAPRDGTTIGGLSPTLIFEPLLSANAVNVDFQKFGWLGSMSESTAIYVSWKTSPVKTARDLFDHDLIIPGTGAASETTVITRALNGILGTRLKVIQGYAGAVAGLLALERGEVDGGFPTLEALHALHPAWLTDHSLNFLFQTRQAPDPEIADVPTVMSLAGNESQRRDLQFLFPRNAFGRPYATPPGVPADRLRALQEAFAAAVNDPELLAEAEKLHIPIRLTGADELAATIREKYATPAEVVERVRRYVPKDAQ